jgi:serine/threonine protein kinase
MPITQEMGSLLFTQQELEPSVNFSSVSEFKFVQQLGEGGCGHVSRVVGSDGRQYALKTITDRKNNLSLMREIRAGLVLKSHPNIVKFLHSFVEKDNTYLVFEYFQGIKLFT